MSDEETETRTINMHPQTPEGIARMVHNLASALAGDDGYIPLEDFKDTVTPYATGWLAVQELIERGEYTEEEIEELAAARDDNR
jgi:hypothetical protein